MRYYLIAGERSGDLHTGNLAKVITRYDDQAVMRGFGGDYMRAAGVDVAVDYNEMAVMGFWEVLMNLNKISRYIRRCKEDILQFKPDVVILVDYGGFNKRIATFAKERGIRTFYYISPKVWAWNQNRAWALKKIVDKMFVILPFEKDFFKRFDWQVDYVGNPVLDAVKAHVPDPSFLSKHGFDPARPLIAFLPGSRKQELLNIVSGMTTLAKRFPDYQFAVAVVNNLAPALYDPLRGLPNVKFVVEDTYNLLQNSTAAVVTSGTATLETALFKVPQIVVYRTSAVTYRIVRIIIRVPFISLVNLIAGKEVVRELIQNDLTEENLASELEALVAGKKRQDVLKEYDAIYKTLDIGSASENAGRLMVEYLSERR
jgi:lipid-A-disaccharide synthase